jgi:hypothetical protein
MANLTKENHELLQRLEATKHDVRTTHAPACLIVLAWPEVGHVRLSSHARLVLDLQVSQADSRA